MISSRFLLGRPNLERQNTHLSRKKKSQPWRLRKSVLHHRLKELLVFELSKDGNREYRNMTLRALYNYVLQAVATRPPDLQVASGLEVRESALSSRGTRRATVQSSHLSQLISKKESVLSIEEEDEEDMDDDDDDNDDDLTTRCEKKDDDSATSRRTRKVGFDADAMEGNMGRRDPVRYSTFAQSSPAHPVTYRERLGGYLHPRDMRRLVTPFSASNEPELIVRRHVMLLNFDPLRAIVLRDRLLVLVPDGADSILETLAKRIRGGLMEIENSVFGMDQSITTLNDSTHKSKSSMASITGQRNKTNTLPLRLASKQIQRQTSTQPTTTTTNNTSTAPVSPDTDTEDEDDWHGFEDNEWDDLTNRGWIDLPFELQSVDGVLHTVCTMLTEEANDLQEFAYEAIEHMLSTDNAANVTGENGHDMLRSIKNEISEIHGRVTGFIRAMNIVLDDDEDLALMNLARLLTHPERFIQPVSQDILHEESDEPELILEAYMQQALSNANALDLLKNEVSNTEELLNMKLDTVRNRLLYINTVVSLLSLTVATGSFVGSLFGMNLINHLEEDDDAFLQVVIGTVVGSFGLLIFLVLVFYRAGHLPKAQ